MGIMGQLGRIGQLGLGTNGTVPDVPDVPDVPLKGGFQNNEWQKDHCFYAVVMIYCPYEKT